MFPMYTVYRCKSKTDDTRKGHIHFANTDKVTLCGKSIDDNWYILTNDHSNGATCPKCLKNCEIVSEPKPITSVDKIRMTIKERNPDFTEEQIEAKMDELFSNLEKFLNEKSKRD